MDQPDSFELATELLGPLPVINAFCARLGLAALLESYLPREDARLRLAPATAVGVVVRNLVIGREPVYALGEWAAPFDPALLGLAEGEAGLLNDDRVGRTLARLFDADRAWMLTRLVLDAVRVFGVDCSRLHNDSTSIKLTGAYPDADGRPRGGKRTAKVTWGHSQDHRPDLKQLVWILTVTADGAVPITYRVADGNTVEDGTHIETWDHLVALLGRGDFLYVAHCKLATGDNMDHIHRNRGRFLSVLPACRKEEAAFRDWVVDHDPAWTEAARRPGRRRDPDEVWHTVEAPWPSAQGHRVVWVCSSAKIDYDAQARADRIARGIAALDQLNQRLAAPKTRMKTTVAVEQAATAAIDQAGAARWIRVSVDQRVEERFRQEKHGRPGADTRYRRSTRTHHRVAYTVDEEQVAHDAASDGCFPLISNDRDLTDAELLAAYKYQPNLGKTPRPAEGHPADRADVPARPRPHRRAAVLPLHRHARPGAVIERQIRAAMKTRGMKQLSIYPEDRGCAAPTAARILEIFTGLARHHLTDRHGNHVQTFHPHVTELQALVLDLLDIPHSVYTT